MRGIRSKLTRERLFVITTRGKYYCRRCRTTAEQLVYIDGAAHCGKCLPPEDKQTVLKL